jgi:hypothetical protein
VSNVLVVLCVISTLVVAAGVVWFFQRKQRGTAPSAEERASIDLAKLRRREYRTVVKGFRKRTKEATKTLVAEQDPKGTRISSVGGVTLYKRYIDTPQGGGSLVGVHAHAEDDSSIASRVTATRLLAIGVFAFAAKKKTGGGNAYVVIEGPDISGVATIAGTKDRSAGPAAFSFAAIVNNVARAAEIAEPGRPQAIAAAQQALARAQDETDVTAARLCFLEAVELVPVPHRSRFDGDISSIGQ